MSINVTSSGDPTSGRGSTGPDTSRTPLSKPTVIAGAVELADEIGIDPLTIRKLATRLGVKPMAIYHHVANKDEILDGMVDSVFAEIELPPDGDDWRTAISVRARSARAALARHPWAAGMMESRPNPGPATLGHHDAVIGCLRRAGFSLEMTSHAYALVDAFIYGFALQEAALPFDTPEETAAVAEAIMESFPTDAYPHLGEFTIDYVLRPGYRFGAEFEFGLDLILDGLDAAARRATDTTA